MDRGNRWTSITVGTYMYKRAVALAVVLWFIAGCGAAAPDGSSGQPTDASAAAQAAGFDPVALIGSWRLTAPGEQPDAILRIAAEGYFLTLWRSCGVQPGSWRADHVGLFVAQLDGDGGCPAPHGADATPGWLRRATAFRIDGVDRVLLDASGVQVARLVPGGHPTPIPANVAPAWAEPPVVTDAARRELAPAAPLPPGLVPASRDVLDRRWVPADSGRDGPKGPFVELHRDGRWHGSDGCNDVAGRWTTGPSGVMLATAGPTTEIGCANILVGEWLARTRQAGLDREVLVLMDARGTELGRLRPI
ncbi:META domain-containing protein [Phytohabitans rumicis]|uniref:DUF306 domain-containing protein n=1 Tax=Phytohabitans rumicis TaxID=1076125 RepID=A0A6V8LGD7_9ACTN|nr:META domain-containing protein [Phytohabitans rumicis]GFJ94710.1 hypothetical protein Prum_083520 [Phytohabitans rumicis]